MTQGSNRSVSSVLGPVTRRWFERNFEHPTEVQSLGWRTIASGKHSLLVAPTGSGKTLAAFLWAIESLVRLHADTPPGVRLLYVSPLKALVNDVERNLRAPLVGIRREGERQGVCLRELSVDVRTGDTPQRERQHQRKNPADILVTTPESLYLILGSRARENLRTVGTVIVDEIHALAPVKRGVHLALSLERLSSLTARDPQRIGLSATVRPTDEVARFLGGDRPVEVVDASMRPQLDLRVTVPVPDMERVSQPPEERSGGAILAQLYARDVGTPQSERGIWSAVYPALLEQILTHRSSIIFVNNRGLCERLVQRLNELADSELVWAHHGSVAHERRAEIEEGLKRGRIRAIVATSSLELGIDMGAVDLVIQLESPGSVARGLQRVGRAGHRVGETSTGRLFPKFRGDLLECAVVAERMVEGALEAISVPRNVLDVLAQQIVAMCCEKPRGVADVEAIVKRAYPYRELGPQALGAVLDMVSGRFPSLEFADLKPMLSWDRTLDTLTARRGTPLLARMNAGTIPDRGNYGVYLGPEGPRVGELDEEMVFETRAGENILLGATTWRVEGITRDRVLVSPAPGEPGRLPFWRGEGPGRPVELGRALGAFTRKLGAMRVADAEGYLREHSPLDEFALRNLTAYLQEQKVHTGALPTDRSITIERFRDELGDWRICILTPFGYRVHAPWALVLQRILSDATGVELQVMYTDDGIVLRFADVEEVPDTDTLIPDPDELEDLLTEQLAGSALFAGLFRENAVRSLLLPRRRPDQRNPLWAQRLKASSLLATVQRFASFPIVLETYRQCLQDVFDLPALKDLLRQIRSRKVRIHDVETRSASPFARSLVFAYVASYIYEQDAPLAERRAQAITLDRSLLSELLGQAELRELLDPQILAEVEAELQCLDVGHHARDADELHDLLRRLGDLELAELRPRCREDPQPWLEVLERSARACVLPVADCSRWIAAEDAGKYRDALGVVPPAGLPGAFLEPAAAPLEILAARYARTHGPFLSRELAERFALRPAQVEPVLQLLEQSGKLTRGELRPGGAEPEWCDVEVLRRLKRRTLAKLRNEVAPRESPALAVFLSRWHGLGEVRPTRDRLAEVLVQLEGLALPWSILCDLILPSRAPGFRVDDLDMLCASGRFVWLGRAALGTADGRIAFYRRENVAALLKASDRDAEMNPIQMAIMECLANRGASFYMDLEQAVRSAVIGFEVGEFRQALWDLVWNGAISNDTVQPLKALRATSSRLPRGRSGRSQVLAGGRWSSVDWLRDETLSDTKRTLARAHMLLGRYGIVSREVVQAEVLEGGFGPIYKVLKAMEEAGRLRRGYFVEGLSAAQFAENGAVDRLRGQESPQGPEDAGHSNQLLTLPAVDPVNPYGSLLPWPPNGAGDAGRPRRVPGAWVILRRGVPVLYVAPGGKQILTFPAVADEGEASLSAAFAALAKLPRGGRRRLLVVEKVDNIAAHASPHLASLTEAGFRRDYRGMTPGHV